MELTADEIGRGCERARQINDEWGQPTPGMQLVAITAGFEGNHSNFLDGIIDKETYAKRAEKFLDDVRLLRPYLESARWPDK